MRTLSTWNRPVSPWKNGGGFTYEVAAFPAGATLESFEWRLSHATVSAAGPFSTFEGIDRALLVISAGALILHSPNANAVRLDRTSAPHAFAGEEAITADVVGPPIEDLNLMTRRSSRRGSLERLRLHEATPIGELEADTVVVALDRAAIGGRMLTPHDAVWLEPGEMATLSPLYAPARLAIARIWRRP
jgi:environmental stress-induced protein Ves